MGYHDSRGSDWHKWDLQIHSPCSLYQYYGGDKDEIWGKFISDLEKLPPDFKSIGICDYNFIDGYRKVLKYKKDGRLKNIDLILPVIELRIKKFSGNEKFKRINFHVIFSEESEISPDTIQEQFLNGLSSKYILSTDVDGTKVTWNGIVTKASIEELGRKIRSTIPKEQLPKFTETDLQLGFNNLNLEEKDIFDLLNRQYFEEKCITAIGKAEWDQLEWNEGSIGEKKTIINGVKIVLTSAETLESFIKSKTALQSQKVNDLLLDCSDAHYFSDSKEKDRIGKCFTWIKADLTFSGLRQAIIEPNDRIFIGDKPEKVKLVSDKKTKYIDSVAINKKNGSSLTEKWFENIELKLNTNLVSIIGNKGSGKSALVDIIALAGKTKKHKHFSFLNKDKFREHDSTLACHFEAKLVWFSGDIDIGLLEEDPKEYEHEKVLYIPQQYLEKICNEEYDQFEKEIGQVIFSHVKESDRFEKDSLEELIKYRSDVIEQKTRVLLEDLHKINSDIIDLESKCTDEYVSSAKSSLESKSRELTSHLSSKPNEAPEPSSSGESQVRMKEINEKIKKEEDNIKKLDVPYNEKVSQEIHLKLKIESCKKLSERLNGIKKLTKTLEEECKVELDNLGIKFDDIVIIEVKTQIVDKMRNGFETNLVGVEKELDENNPDSLYGKILKSKNEIVELKNKLDEPNLKYQEYKKALQNWEDKKNEIEGGEDKPNSIKGLKKLINYLENQVKADLGAKREKRLKNSGEIYDCLTEKTNIFKELYMPVEEFIKNNKLSKDIWQLKFEASIKEKGLLSMFFGYISQNARGTFCGSGFVPFGKLLDETDFNSKSGCIEYLKKVINLLESDNREGIPEDERKRYIVNQLRKGEAKKKPVELIDFYDELFSLNYLNPSFILKLVDKELSQLSPGERGALLLMFYLLIDKNDIPIIIDQPEENLDNQSVYTMLVPAIKEAKKRRQIIIVTHNPNLAVVCNSEQIIRSNIDKAEQNLVTYSAGAIENPIINKDIVDVLEGTMPAFRNRDSKYDEKQ
ncbi:MAG: DNA repair protein [Candidatus Omnitrophica bacterium]|nr:DNA repair protein [Candidatus Omnitrophota bacterium]MDD5736740.1 DNA repair protein [Candidatus Omnitrophota bacterium]